MARRTPCAARRVTACFDPAGRSPRGTTGSGVAKRASPPTRRVRPAHRNAHRCCVRFARTLASRRTDGRNLGTAIPALPSEPPRRTCVRRLSPGAQCTDTRSPGHGGRERTSPRGSYVAFGVPARTCSAKRAAELIEESDMKRFGATGVRPPGPFSQTPTTRRPNSVSDGRSGCM